jgi:hypothetical protein
MGETDGVEGFLPAEKDPNAALEYELSLDLIKRERDLASLCGTTAKSLVVIALYLRQQTALVTARLSTILISGLRYL